ncbi:MAG: hypothetical protein M1816_006021 [Peltula sp. TS41687]|nr:MAG: hypothetical protein M1816_006021 [Peltula sp. TS41687]
MLSSQPKGRNAACETCHRHKIKCHVPSEGVACLACQNSRRQCYFLPKSKGGRPRRDRKASTASTTSSEQQSTTFAPDTSKQNIPSAPLAFPSGNGQPDAETYTLHERFDWQSTPLGLPMPTPDPLDAETDAAAFRQFSEENCFVVPNSSSELWSDQNCKDFSRSLVGEWPGRSSVSVLPTQSPALVEWSSAWPMTPSSDKDSSYRLSRPSQRDSSSLDSNTPSFPNTPFSLMSPMASWSPPSLKKPDEQDQELEGTLAGLLRHSVLLQQNSEEMKKMGSTGAQVSSGEPLVAVLQSIDSSCNFISGIFGDPSSTSASPRSVTLQLALLAVVMTLEIFDVCYQLFHNKTINTQSLDCILLLKRLEFNVMQARIALIQIGRLDQSLLSLTQDTIKKGLMVDRKLKSLAEEIQMCWG